MTYQFDYRGKQVVIERRGDLFTIKANGHLLDDGRSTESIAELEAVARSLIDEIIPE